MEFFLGAFEKDWQRRRAALLHELQAGQTSGLDWDWRRRGGVARLPEPAGGRRGRRETSSLGGVGARGEAHRSMRQRFSALARGSQPAVVKLASYGGASRAGAMMSYAAREGGLAVENERGETISGRTALNAVRGEWEHLFDNRADSRDVAVFNVSVASVSFDGHDAEGSSGEVLRAGFGDRRFVFGMDERGGDKLVLRGVVVLRDRGGERLTGDGKAAEVVQRRFDESELGNGVEAQFRFHGYGNGVRFATARVRDLVERFEGEVRDETGRLVATPNDAGDLVQKDWRHAMHSRKGRDVMHLIVSARAGTEPAAFQAAVRDFLGEQFAGHRYIFAVHDPAEDPKDMAEGGKRPHIHAHAIVTMRAEAGERIVTSPQVFREWRARMAEAARGHGIDMELTDRRDQVSPPAYSRNQVRPVSYAGRTEHAGTTEAAQARYEAKRSDIEMTAGSSRSRPYVEAAAETWRELAESTGDHAVASYAEFQIGRMKIASQRLWLETENRQVSTQSRTNMVMSRALADIEEAAMQQMTRPEFEAYEKRVEAVLSSVGRSVDEADRASFEEIAAAARDVVNVRREYLDLSEQQLSVESQGARQEDRNARADVLHGHAAGADQTPVRQSAEAANEVLAEIRSSRETLNRTGPDDHSAASVEANRENLNLGLWRAAELAVEHQNTHLREAAKDDVDLADRIKLLERMREDRGASYNDGFEGRPIPDIAKSDAKLLAHYEQGLRALELEIAVTDAENGIGSVGWGRADGSWTRQDSEAAWENFNRRSSELQAFQAEQAQAAQTREGPSTAVESASDNRALARGRDDDRAAPPAPDEIARERDDNLSGPERQHVPPPVVRDRPERTADAAQSDPPQQHVPRLQELEREINERQERDRDRER